MPNLQSVNYIITAKHYGDGSARSYIRKMQQDVHRKRGVAVHVRELDAEPTGVPVLSLIHI